MTRSEYLKTAFDLFNADKISEEVYDAMLMNIEEFVDEDEEEGFLPSTYAEIEYTAEQLESDPIAIEGAKWDDMNYLHYRER